MRKIWLSTTYYQDPKVAGLSADAERVLTRGWAYSGSAETRGFIPDSVLVQLGNKRGSRPIQELTNAGLWLRTEGGYRIANWDVWQETGDELLKRKEKDRERKRRQRERSQEASRDVTAPNKEEEKNRTSSRLAAAPCLGDAGGREQPLPGRVPIEGWALVRETIPDEHPQQVRSALAVKAADLLSAGTPRADVQEALALWLAKPQAGAGLLPSLVSEAVKNRAGAARPARGSPAEKALGWLAIAADHEAKAQAKNIQGHDRRELDP